MRPFLILAVMATLFTLPPASRTEAGPVRRAVAWKMAHNPVRNFFGNRKPVRKAVRFAGRGVKRAAGVAVRGTRGAVRGAVRGARCAAGNCR